MKWVCILEGLSELAWRVVRFAGRGFPKGNLVFMLVGIGQVAIATQTRVIVYEREGDVGFVCGTNGADGRRFNRAL